MNRVVFRPKLGADSPVGSAPMPPGLVQAGPGGSPAPDTFGMSAPQDSATPAAWIYLNNAATSFPKPHEVQEAVLRSLGRPPSDSGRSGGGGDDLAECRRLLAQLFGVDPPSHVLLSPSATFALNQVITGVAAEASDGAEIVVTSLEHNSVLRPVERLRRERHLTLRIVEPGSDTFADLLVNSVSGEMIPVAQQLLVNAANECGYHTGYGIITSEEWKSVVAPMVEKVPEDVLHGAFAVFTAWGWAKAEVVELVPGKRMVVRAYDYYESDIVSRGATKLMSAYMIQGVASAFMDLAYGSPYPAGRGTFKCSQVKGLECGDDHGEFVVTRA